MLPAAFHAFSGDDPHRGLAPQPVFQILNQRIRESTEGDCGLTGSIGSLRTSMGLRPAASCWRAAAAFSRACASGTDDSPPTTRGLYVHPDRTDLYTPRNHDNPVTNGSGRHDE